MTEVTEFSFVEVQCASEGCGNTFKVDASNWSSEYQVFCSEHRAEAFVV